MPEIDNKSLKAAVNQNGRVSVYDLESRRTKQVAPVDARDLIQAGTCTLKEPRVQMTGPAGPVVVMHRDIERREKENWKLLDVPAPEENNDQDPVIESPAPYDFSKHAVPELKEFAKQAGIEVPSGANKDKVVELLAESNFTPEIANKTED